jgi:prevent-host-death family protein
VRSAEGAVVTDTVNLHAAKANLSKLVDRAAAGEEIIIAKAGKPKAKLVPFRPLRKKRRFGQNLLGPCRPKYRNISSKVRAAADRHAYPALGG